jgi:hypothetical protein
MAMALAANGYVVRNFSAMSDKANAMYPRVLAPLSCGKNICVGSHNEEILAAYIWKDRAELQNQGARNAKELSGSLTQKWNWIKEQIKVGLPVVASVGTTRAGHLLLIVGWREVNGVRKIIVYDPYGRWLGGTDYKYDRNTTSSGSAKGRWVEYDLNKVGLGWLITTGPKKTLTALADAPAIAEDDDVPSSPPGEPTVDEPEDIVVFDGVIIGTDTQIYLPLILR